MLKKSCLTVSRRSRDRADNYRATDCSTTFIVSVIFFARIPHTLARDANVFLVYFEIAEILNMRYVRINTKIKFIACEQPALSNVI